MLSSPQMIVASRERLVDREDRWHGIDLDGGRAAGLLRAPGVRVREQHDRLFGVVDAVVGEARLVVDDERDAVDAGNVGGRDDDELVPGNVGPNSSR